MSKFTKIIPYILILAGVGIIILTFWPVAKEEVRYQARQIIPQIVKPVDLTPPNKSFSIVIPKIEAVSAIIAGVDPSDPKKYLPALRMGVAQAKGTALPGQIGNLYLFAHSTDAFYDVSAYNAVFFLIGKLQTGDEVDIYYQGKLFKYAVYDKKVVPPDASYYFGTISPGQKTLTLQTCYPPGTTLERLIVLAKQID